MSKYLITGGAGFIGSHLIDYLVDYEKVPESDIRVFVPPWETLNRLSGRKLELVIGDIRDKKIVSKSMEKIDVVFHLASKTGYDGGSYEYFKDTIVDGTENLINVAAQNNIKKFIYFSSTAVYGLPATAGDICGFDEKHVRSFSEGYGQAKYESELLIERARKTGNTNYIIIRPTTVYGPRDNGGVTQLIKSIKNGYFFFIGNGSNKMDYVYVKDVARISCEIAKSGIKNEDFIICSSKPITQKEMVAVISKQLEVNFPKLRIPINLALVISFIVKYLSKSLRIRPILFPNRVRVLSSSFYFKSSKLKKFGFKTFYDFKLGIKETLEIFKNS